MDTSAEVEAYESNFDHLQDQLSRLELLIERQLLWQRTRQPANPLEQFKGLVISEEEVAALLAKARPEPSASPDPGAASPREMELCTARLRELEQSINRRLQGRTQAQLGLALPQLKRLFGLTTFEVDCLLVCLAPELDRKFEKLYAFLQDDVTRKKPTLDLVLSLLGLSATERIAARSAFGSQAPLLRYRLVHVREQTSEDATPLLSRPLKLDDRIVNFILGQPQLDARLEMFTQFVSVSPPLDQLRDDNPCHRVLQFLHHQSSSRNGSSERILFHCHGPDGAGKHALVHRVAQELGLPILLADLGRMAAGCLPIEEAALLLAREAVLHPALLCIENGDLLLTAEERLQTQVKPLLNTLFDLNPMAFLLSRRPWTPQGRWGGRFPRENPSFVSVALTMPDDEGRAKIWRETLAEAGAAGEDFDCPTLASKFRFTAGQIRNAWSRALHQAAWETGSEANVSMTNLCAACREGSDQSLAALAKKIEPKYTWDDIVLPEDAQAQLREMCQRVALRQRVLGEWGFDRKLSQGKGVNALFAGPSGTGKTMAAEIIAGELGLQLYRIDLSGVVSKYIGETEKNLDRIFTAAEGANAILFFDEADALFGKRSEVRDSHDRYANIEISYLLQKIEEYEGVAILATNLRQNLDESFVRRLAFTIHFPFPDEADRARIWEGIWPKATPLAEDIDLDFMARQFKLSGGNIRNIALAAAFLAAENGGIVTQNDLLRATRREYQKLGKNLTPAEIGSCAQETSS